MLSVHEQIERRLGELKRDLGAGRSELNELQARETYLREATLRISGAIQVLEELIANGSATAPEKADDVHSPAIEDLIKSPDGEGEDAK
jgi:hypothetical protein